VPDSLIIINIRAALFAALFARRRRFAWIPLAQRVLLVALHLYLVLSVSCPLPAVPRQTLASPAESVRRLDEMPCAGDADSRGEAKRARHGSEQRGQEEVSVNCVSVPWGDGVVGNQGSFCASQGDGSFERWLHATGAWWDEKLVEIRSPWRAYSPDDNVPSFLRDGWGLMSRDKKIKKGTVICRVPKEASFRGDEGKSCTEEQDTQLHLAIRLLREKRKGCSSDFWPKIATLPSRVPVCWAWAQNEREWLKGSELEFVVRRKLERLDAEFRESIEPLGEGFSKAEYVDACASVISHANPWWGVSSVSFVDMGNHDDDPHVEFRQQGDHVVGTVVKTIPRKSEIYQSYGELGSADLLYRYGFTREGPGAEVYIYMLSSPATLPCMHAHTQERAHDQEMPARKLAVEVNSEEQLYFLLNVTNFVNQYMM
jgi:hypothetical protein